MLQKLMAFPVVLSLKCVNFLYRATLCPRHLGCTLTLAETSPSSGVSAVLLDGSSRGTGATRVLLVALRVGAE